MQAEVINFSTCCQELMPIINVDDEVGTTVGLTQSETQKANVFIHKDNVGLLVIAQTLPPQFTPASKHYAVKTH